MKILDSDHCIALLRGHLDLRGRVAPTETLTVTAISVGELVHGVYKSTQIDENLARLGVLLAAVRVLPYDQAAARYFGRTKAELERMGQKLSDIDLQIASIALAQGIPLITHNRRHFERIADLAIEDWLA
jgi:tRNA(fMet)-specific endonuclease VapC